MASLALGLPSVKGEVCSRVLCIFRGMPLIHYSNICTYSSCAGRSWECSPTFSGSLDHSKTWECCLPFFLPKSSSNVPIVWLSVGAPEREPRALASATVTFGVTLLLKWLALNSYKYTKISTEEYTPYVPWHSYICPPIGHHCFPEAVTNTGPPTSVRVGVPFIPLCP